MNNQKQTPSPCSFPRKRESSPNNNVRALLALYALDAQSLLGMSGNKI